MRSLRAAKLLAQPPPAKAGVRRQCPSRKTFRSSSAARVYPKPNDSDRIVHEFPCPDNQAENPSPQALVPAKSDADPAKAKPSSSPSLLTSRCVYCLISANFDKTYVGVTKNMRRRIRQHNGEISGGSKATRGGRPWTIICTVQGFATWREACQVEWHWKNFSKKTSSVKLSSVGGSSSISKVSLRHSHLAARRRAALERVKRLNEWNCLDIKWYLNSSNDK